MESPSLDDVEVSTDVSTGADDISPSDVDVTNEDNTSILSPSFTVRVPSSLFGVHVQTIPVAQDPISSKRGWNGQKYCGTFREIKRNHRTRIK